MLVGLNQLFFGMGANGAVAQWLAHAQQRVALADLIVLEVRLVALIHFAADQFACPIAAGSSSAAIGQVDSLLIRRLKDVNVIGAAEPLAVFQCDRVGGHEWLEALIQC